MDPLILAGRTRTDAPASPARATGVARLLIALCVIAAIFTALDLAAVENGLDMAAPTRTGEPR